MTDTHSTPDGTTDRGTLADVDHTHPHTERSFGANFTFARGGTVAADGGRPDVAPEAVDLADDGGGAEDATGREEGEPAGAPERERQRDALADVSHTTPNDSEDASRVFERGGQRRPGGPADE